MPIYEYRCMKCDGEFEELVMASDEVIVCPACGGGEVRRLLSVCGFKSGGEKGAAGSRMGSSASSCTGCTASTCDGCH